jgi:hypothetical protein
MIEIVGWVCRLGCLSAHVIGGIDMIGMVGWVCRVEWALRPCNRRDRYDRLGM